MEESRKYVKIEMDTSELDDVLKKVEKLREVLLEAKTLLDELASKEIALSRYVVRNTDRCWHRHVLVIFCYSSGR